MTVNKERINFVQSRKGQNVIIKYHYKLQMTQSNPSKRSKMNPDQNETEVSNEQTLQLVKTKKNRAVDDIINSWSYTGEAMTREVIVFHDFINVTVNKFEDLVRLHGDYNKMYERYSRVLLDEPESRSAMFVLLKNVERVHTALTNKLLCQG